MALEVRMRVRSGKQTPASTLDMFAIVKQYDEMRRKYADKWVAVKNSKVVMSHEELEPLLEALRKEFGTSQGFTVEFIGSQTRNMLL
jgi:hypothetical protein